MPDKRAVTCWVSFLDWFTVHGATCWDVWLRPRSVKNRKKKLLGFTYDWGVPVYLWGMSYLQVLSTHVCVLFRVQCLFNEWIGTISNAQFLWSPTLEPLTWLHAGAGPTNDISIEFETRPKFAVLWFKCTLPITTKLCNCRDVCKILLWLVTCILN